MHIAVCGELGSGCTEVGQRISRRLGLKCISSSDIIRAIVVNFRGVHPDESFQEFEKHVRSGEVNLDRMLGSKIDEFLEQGDTVVEGRSAFLLLNNKNAFKVLLVASLNDRIEHIAKRRNIATEEAKEAIRASDSERKHVVERLFKKEWLDPHYYDLTVNTGTRNYEETADLIIKAMPIVSRPG